MLWVRVRFIESRGRIYHGCHGENPDDTRLAFQALPFVAGTGMGRGDAYIKVGQRQMKMRPRRTSRRIDLSFEARSTSGGTSRRQSIPEMPN